MLQIIRHMLGEKNVPGITAIHHPLRHVDASPGDVRVPVHVGDLIHRSAVNAHAHRKLRMFLKRFGNLERAAHRRFRAVAKDQAPAIAGRQPNEFFFRFDDAELRGPRTISVNWFSCSFCSLIKNFE